MPIEKPLPLMVGNKAYYSLTSYDPVEIEVNVPYTSDEDIELGLEMTLADMGGSMASLDDPAWIAEHFEGLSSADEVRKAMRQEVLAMNANAAEQQKVGACVEALAARLCQSIPPQHIDQMKQAIRMHFTQQLAADGMTPEQFMTRTGTSPAQLEAMFDRQARQAAEGDAALSAYAHERKLKVDEQEFGRLLGIPATEVQNVIDQARAAGQYDDMREAALRSKAAQLAVAECSCSYRHETPGEARVRMMQYRKLREEFERQMADGEADSQQDSPEKTGFKLV